MTTRILSIEARTEVALRRLCRLTGARPALVAQLVEHGVVEVRGSRPLHWTFDDRALARALRALRMQRDLGLNAPGVALAMELSDEVRRLRSQLRQVRQVCDEG